MVISLSVPTTGKSTFFTLLMARIVSPTRNQVIRIFESPKTTVAGPLRLHTLFKEGEKMTDLGFLVISCI